MESSSSSETSSENSENEIYEREFGKYKTKHISVGPKHQVDSENVPLITDMLDSPELYENDVEVH